MKKSEVRQFKNSGAKFTTLRGLLLFFLLLLCLLTQTFGAAKKKRNNNKIVGGYVTHISKVPYLVNLRHSGHFICGGTLVSLRYVITAAHCVKGLRARSLKITGGASKLSSRGVQRSVSRIVMPSSYDIYTLDMDVAVLQLSRIMRGHNIRPIGLCNSQWHEGDHVKVSGWGFTNENGHYPSNWVRSIWVPLISKAQCLRYYYGHEILTKSMFCAAKMGVKDSCSGDSGGPVIFKGRLCGVVSWGLGCARPNYPGVYTNINVVRGFIDTAMYRYDRKTKSKKSKKRTTKKQGKGFKSKEQIIIS